MLHRLIALFVIMFGLSFSVHADVLLLDGVRHRAEQNIDTPRRGISMAKVEKVYGSPTRRDSAVGDPPITRWDYDQFSVFFEHQHVIHAVIKNN